MGPSKSLWRQILSLSRAVDSVRRFHMRVGAPMAGHPRLLPCDPSGARELMTALAMVQKLAARFATEQPSDELATRTALALEELGEWLAAHAHGDLVAAADAWADRMYLLLGDAVATGLPAEELFDEVNSSNMTKCADSLCSGKAVKGSAYRPPDIRRILDLARLSR